MHCIVWEFGERIRVQISEPIPVDHVLTHFSVQILINDAKDKRSQRLDSEPKSFIEVFLDKIQAHSSEAGTIFTRESRPR